MSAVEERASIGQNLMPQIFSSANTTIALIDCILTGILLLVTGVSVYFAFRAYRHQKERAKKDAACDLAKYYAYDIMEKFQFVLDVLVASKLSVKIQELFPYDAICTMDRKELDKVLQKAGKTFSEVEREIVLVPPEAIYTAKVLSARSIAERNLIAKEYIVIQKADKDSPPRTKIVHENLLHNEYLRKVAELLNCLEYFAMNCRYGLADEEMLYQSLHQTYISQVRLLYFFICKSNITNEDKVFTNLIWLFDLWKNRLKKIQEDTLSARTEAEKKFQEAKIQLQEAQDEMESISSIVYTGNSLK